MTKADIEKIVAEKFDITKTMAGEIASFLLDTIVEETVKDGRTAISGHYFKKVERAERQGRNPQTQQPMTIPASTWVVYRRRIGKKA